MPGTGIRERGISLPQDAEGMVCCFLRVFGISGCSPWRLFVPAHVILAPSGKYFPDTSEHSGAAEGGIGRVNYISGSFFMQGV